MVFIGCRRKPLPRGCFLAKLQPFKDEVQREWSHAPEENTHSMHMQRFCVALPLLTGSYIFVDSHHPLPSSPCSVLSPKVGNLYGSDVAWVVQQQVVQLDVAVRHPLGRAVVTVAERQ